MNAPPHRVKVGNSGAGKTTFGRELGAGSTCRTSSWTRPSGNRDRWPAFVQRDPEENTVLWAWTQHDAYRAQYLRLAADGSIGAWSSQGRRRSAS